MSPRRPHRLTRHSIVAVMCMALITGCGAEDRSTTAEGLVPNSPSTPETPVTPVTPVSPVTPSAPAAPTGLAATSGNGQANLTWSASTGATGYSVKRGTTSGGAYTQLATVATTSYADTGVTTGTTYFYVVAAVNATGTSPNSSQASITITAAAALAPGAIPAAPAGLSASAGNARVNLTWTATSGAASYRVKRATTSGGPYTQVAAPTSAGYNDISLTNGTTYYYVVTAVNTSGESSNSAQASAKPAAPAVVGGCDNLPAAGVWENLTPAGTSKRRAVNGTVTAAVIVDPFDSRRIWLGTGDDNDEIWRSDNCGATWTRVNTGAGSIVGDGYQWSMQADPVNQGTLYSVSGYGAQSLWKTTDGGVNWTDVLKGSVYDSVAAYRFVNNVALDPTDNKHLAVSTHGDCAAPYSPSCIAESKDGGATWRVLKGPESWFEGGGLIIVKGAHWLWCGAYSMKVTKDAGASWTDIGLAGGGGCEAEYTIRSFEPASNGKYYVGSRNGVLRSTNGENWERIPGTSGFMVMVAQSSKKLFVANQWQPSIKWANLSNDEVWTDIPVPPQLSGSEDQGISFLAYDESRGILYASMFTGGIARIVIP